jgi:hypothetical protein
MLMASHMRIPKAWLYGGSAGFFHDSGMFAARIKTPR